MTKLIENIKDLKEILKRSPKPIGLIPTMGALHNGHLSLIQKAKDECKTTVVSIFVNPTQFNENEDYKIYPRDIKGDFKKCESMNVDYIFTPSEKEMYPESESAKLLHPPDELSSILCGKTRKNHFAGVATVVKKLIDIVEPENIYFGKKDLQQIYIIKWLIKEFNLNIKLFECPIIRAENGLALSSRNVYLIDSEKKTASNLYKSLVLAKENMMLGIFTPRKAIVESLIFLAKFPQIHIEYFEAKDKNSLEEVDEKKQKDFYFFLAAKINNIRLIDNIEI